MRSLLSDYVQELILHLVSSHPIAPYHILSFSLHAPSILIGELDETLDQAVDLASIRAEPIPPIRY